MKHMRHAKPKPKKSLGQRVRSFFKEASARQWFFRGLFTVFLCVFLFSAWQLLGWFLDNQAVSRLEDEVSSMAQISDIPDEESHKNVPDDYWAFLDIPYLGVKFDELLQRNSDTVGWVQVGGTSANYPVVQTTDNSYYLTHAFDGSYNPAGWLFADYRCDMVNLGRNTIIYGHERLNATMFGSLKLMLEEEWFNNPDNHVVRFATPTQSMVFQVFSIFVVEPESRYLTTDFASDADWLAFLQEMQARSIYDFGVTLTAQDQIITLSTCYGEDRQVVMARLVKSTDLVQ